MVQLINKNALLADEIDHTAWNDKCNEPLFIHNIRKLNQLLPKAVANGQKSFGGQFGLLEEDIEDFIKVIEGSGYRVEYEKHSEYDDHTLYNIRILLVEDPNYYCSNCHKVLKRQWFNDDGAYQFDGNLVISFHGGYGMYQDDIGQKQHPKSAGLIKGVIADVNFCKECADKLCKEFPVIAEVLYMNNTEDEDNE